MRSTDSEFAGVTDTTSPTESAVGLAARTTRSTVPKAAYIRESNTENYLRGEVKKRAGRCDMEKHVSPGRRGVPDDLITWGHPLCLMEFIETKAPKGETKKHQDRDHARRARLGIRVHKLYTKSDVDAYFVVMDKLMSLV